MLVLGDHYITAVDLSSSTNSNIAADDLTFTQLTQIGSELELDPDQYQMDLI